jgi:hypothetical protein
MAYSDQELLNHIKRLAQSIGETPTLRDLEKQGDYSPNPYYSHFGSWSDALREAGFTPKIGGKEKAISRNKLISELKRLRERLGRVPRKDDMREHGKYSHNPYRREFGSWGDALLSIGWSPAINRHSNREDLIAELHRLRDDLGHTPTKRDLKQRGRFGYGTYRREFGKWATALREAGMEPQAPKDITEEDLVGDLKSVKGELGHPPTKYEYMEHGQYHPCTIRRRLGSYAKGFEEAGIEHSEYPTGKDHHEWRGGLVEKSCSVCGVSLERKPYQVEKSDVFFCSPSCRGEWISENRSGKNNPMWEGGRVPYGPGFGAKKKRDVRIRDQARCQHCGRTEPEHLNKFGTKHVIHHIVPARTINDPEERNAMDNLITLCRGDCHHTWEKSAPGRPDSVAQAD